MSKTPREVLAENNWDIGLLRPYLNEKGESVVTKWTGKTGKHKRQDGTEYDAKIYEVVPSEIPALNTKEQMMEIDRQTLRAAKFRLRVTGKLLELGLKYDVGMPQSKTILEHESQTEDVPKVVATGKPAFMFQSLPLPAIQSATWKLPKTPIGTLPDLIACEAGGRSTAEAIEKMVIGVGEPFDHEGHKVYGLLNNPWKHELVLDERPLVEQIDDAIKQLEAKKFYGPYLVLHGSKYDAQLDNDYPLLGDMADPNYGKISTQREAVRKIVHYNSEKESYNPVIDCMRMDYADDDIVIVQATTDVIRIVVGLNITPVRWEDGYQTWAGIVPQIRADYYETCGIVHIRKA